MDKAAVDPRIASALAWGATQGGSDLTLAIPFSLPAADARALLQIPGVLSVILPEASVEDSASERIGAFLPEAYSWRLPTRVARRLLYVGSPDRIRSRMIRAALIGGVRSLCYWDLDRWVSRSPAVIAASRVGRILSSRIQARLSRFPAWDAVSAMGSGGSTDRRLRRLLDAKSGLLPDAQHPVSGRIVIACPTLVAGGAERQIVNTVLGLRQRGHADIIVLVSNLYSPPGNDFFRDRLVGAGVEVQEVQGPLSTRDGWTRWGSLPESGVLKGLRPLLSGLPPETSQEVANLYVALRALRPAVVHAWLDHSCVCAGLAALMAGVPRVLLSGRNVSPIHFPYILKPIMRPAYRAMAARAQTLYLNNSHGGAADYAAWLGLEIKRFRILYNGFDSVAMTRAASDQIAAFRSCYGIPEHARLVGGLFRLSPEKRPELWVDTLVRVTSERDDVYGLVFGAGPLQASLEARLVRAGVADRVRLVPPTKESHLALSAFDVLLLASQWEGTPNVAIEAQAVGTPVVVSGGGGAREALLHGVTGLFVEQPTTDALSDTLLSLLDDPALRQRLAEAGPGFVAERFGLDRMVSETLRAYGF